MSARGLKIAASLAMIMMVAISVPILADINEPRDYSEGMLIDFGRYDGVWVPMEKEEKTIAEALDQSCTAKGYAVIKDVNGIPESINGITNNSVRTWTIWTTPKGSGVWEKQNGSPEDLYMKDFGFVTFAFSYEGYTPLSCVDAEGRCIFNDGTLYRTITLAPSCTEMYYAIHGIGGLVGTDLYSNYPAAITDMRGSGRIAAIGGYTNPSYEKVLGQRPDIVIGEADIGGHLDVAKRLRSTNVVTLMLPESDSTDAICRNIWAIGQATGNPENAKVVTDNITEQLDNILSGIKNTVKKDVLLALGILPSAFTSGDNTYMDDATQYARGTNIFGEENLGWFPSSAEEVKDRNPQVIIIVSESRVTTQAEYDEKMEWIKSNNPQWAGTDAFKNGEVYFFSGQAADVLSRPGPRVCQAAELLANALHPERFSNPIPKYVSDDYKDYLTVSAGW